MGRAQAAVSGGVTRRLRFESPCLDETMVTGFSFTQTGRCFRSHKQLRLIQPETLHQSTSCCAYSERADGLRVPTRAIFKGLRWKELVNTDQAFSLVRLSRVNNELVIFRYPSTVYKRYAASVSGLTSSSAREFRQRHARTQGTQ
jgi:hypothetical protein